MPIVALLIILLTMPGCATMPAIQTLTYDPDPAAPLGTQAAENYYAAHQARGWYLHRSIVFPRPVRPP